MARPQKVPPLTLSPDPEPRPHDHSESKIHEELGKARLLFMIAADVMLGFLVGQLSRMHTDEDYAAWRKLLKIAELDIQIKERIAELRASIEIAQKLCMAAILRALNQRHKRKPPYHGELGVVGFLLFALATVHVSRVQTIERYEGILIDTSASIAKGGAGDELFREYLASTKKLLLTEPANSRVWVSSIASDSFGGVGEIARGWTPDTRGVFTDDLNRARHQLAASLDAKSSAMAAVSSGTDIFGGLWRMKALLQSTPESEASRAVSKTIWIFSDMMNETKEFPMATLISMGPGRMVERTKARGLLVPLYGYRVRVLGASTRGLTPQKWMLLQRLWKMYFSAAGAQLAAYSMECHAGR